MPRRDLFFSQLIQNLGSAGALVADHFMACTLLQLLNEFGWETVLRKGLKRGRDMQSHHLPVAGHGIFSAAGFSQFSIAGQGRFHWRYTLKLMKICHTQLLKVRNLEILCPRCDMP